VLGSAGKCWEVLGSGGKSGGESRRNRVNGTMGEKNSQLQPKIEPGSMRAREHERRGGKGGVSKEP